MIYLSLLPTALLVAAVIPVYCEEKCTAPPVYNHTVNNGSDTQLFPTGAVVSYLCSPGYRIRSGKTLATCVLKDGKASWTKVTLKCSLKSCPTPSKSFAHGKVIGNLYVFGSNITYQCDAGYKLKGNRNTRHCLATGKWSELHPVCEAIDCGKPSSKDVNVKFHFHSTTYESRVKYSCTNDSLEINGQTTSECSSSGKWEPPAPECKKYTSDCPLPKMYLPGGIVKVSGDIVLYICNDGVTDRSSTCVNKKWTPEPPVCSVVTSTTSAPTTTENACSSIKFTSSVMVCLLLMVLQQLF